jgi:cytochrome c
VQIALHANVLARARPVTEEGMMDTNGQSELRSLLSRSRLLLVFAAYLAAFIAASALMSDPRRMIQQLPADDSRVAHAAGNTFESICVACHMIGEGHIGPSLAGVVGRKAGTVPGFAYSDPMRLRNVVWTPENLKLFLKNPGAFVPGTTMAISPLDDRSIAEVISYLDKL